MNFSQEVFAGLTSTGGPEGGGTAFTINSDGTGFSLLHPFRKLGTYPTGNLIQASDGHLYGMTQTGGASNAGTVFRMTLDGAVTILHHLDTFTANRPEGSLVEGPDGHFYATSPNAGLQDMGTLLGTVFRVTRDGEVSLVKTFSVAEGYRPYGDLVLGPDGNFYGMVFYGGDYNFGTVFSLTPTGTLKVLHSFNGATDGGWPKGNLTLGEDGNFYGMTTSEKFGRHNGTIFRIMPTGQFTVLKSLTAEDGSVPYGSLVKYTDGSFYGTLSEGGNNFAGTIFRITPDGDFRVVRHLDLGVDGGGPRGNLVVGNDGQLYGTTNGGGEFGFGTIFRMSPGGEELTVLHHLQGASDGHETDSLLLASDGNFYGMAAKWGAQFEGTIFRITPAGDFTVLEALPGSYKGSTPVNSLTQGQDNGLYGTTYLGGQYGYGSIFRLDPNGEFAVLRSLDLPNGYDKFDGIRPQGNLIQGQDGNFYGLTPEGGMYGSGSFFRITPEGEYTLVYSFEDGEFGGAPHGSLVVGPDGAFYGMTQKGGFMISGVIFRITMDGFLTVIHGLDSNADGAAPRGSLLLGQDGNFYGLTALGGDFNNGTIFRVSPNGDFARLFSFDRHNHGGNPFGDLVQDGEGNLYGMTNEGGKFEGGVIFKCTLAGEVTVLHHFGDPESGGHSPHGSLLWGADGSLYGMTPVGGHHYHGAIFKLSLDGTYSVVHSFNPATEGDKPLGSLIRLRPVPGSGG